MRRMGELRLGKVGYDSTEVSWSVERTGSELLPKNADAHRTKGQHCSGKTAGRETWEDWEDNGE